MLSHNRSSRWWDQFFVFFICQLIVDISFESIVFLQLFSSSGNSSFISFEIRLVKKIRFYKRCNVITFGLIFFWRSLTFPPFVNHIGTSSKLHNPFSTADILRCKDDVNPVTVHSVWTRWFPIWKFVSLFFPLIYL